MRATTQEAESAPPAHTASGTSSLCAPRVPGYDFTIIPQNPIQNAVAAPPLIETYDLGLGRLDAQAELSKEADERRW
jgi:hypothetical protein